MTPEPPPGPALAHPPTRTALRRLAARAAAQFVVAVAVLVVLREDAGGRGAVVFIVAACMGGTLFLLSVAVRFRFARYPWRLQRIRCQRTGGHPNPAVVADLAPGFRDCPGPFAVVGIMWRWGGIAALDGRQVWTCGLGRRWAAVAPPGVGNLYFLRRPRLRRIRLYGVR